MIRCAQNRAWGLVDLLSLAKGGIGPNKFRLFDSPAQHPPHVEHVRAGFIQNLTERMCSQG